MNRRVGSLDTESEMVSTLRGGQKITTYKGERLGVGYTPSIRALALNIATCEYAKPLAIALRTTR